MPDTPRQPRRADALRNRERVLEAARELIASEGVEVPLDEIARRAGVGAGTLHRNFPTKESLLAAIVFGDLRRRIAEARELSAEADGGEALFTLLARLLDDGRTNRSLKAALGGTPLAVDPSAAQEFREALGALVAAGQRAGTVRRDVEAADVEAVLAGALAAQEHAGGDEARVRRVRALALAGLRAPARD